MKLNTSWLDWQPITEKVHKRLEHSLTEPTKPSSVSFGGATPSLFQTISVLEAQPEAYEEGIERWITTQCVFRDRAWGGLGALHNDYAIWCDQVGREVPANLRIFKFIVQGSGFRITDDGLVYGLVLGEDLRVPGKAGRP